MKPKRRSRARTVQVVSATRAAKTFGRLIEHVRSERAEYVVERGGTPAVRIVPASERRCTGADLIGLFKAHAKVDEEYLAAVESGVSSLNRPSVPKNQWDS
jgi:hypothetical protein